jgi:lycopene cyclase domain-containing protein
MPLYLSLLLISVIIPLGLSFDRKVGFHRHWKTLFPSVIIVGSVYITADIFFVKAGIWGFNPAYHSKIVLLGLPLEEWLFFVLIPYACVFIHYVFISYFPDLILSNIFVRIFSAILIVIILTITIINYNKTYTLFNFSLLIISILIALFDRHRLLNRYYISFLIMLIPFFIVNSILTGTLIPGEVVWYNNSEIIGIRLLTVPVEDTGYAFSLVLLNLLLINRFQEFYKQHNI